MNDPRKRSRLDADLYLKSMGEETTNTTGASVEIHPLSETTGLIVQVTETGGTTPTLDIVIEGSDDEQSWSECAILPTIQEGASKTTLSVGALNYTYYRYKSTIGGANTPAFTYAIYLTN